MIAQLSHRIPGLVALVIAAGVLSACGGTAERPSYEAPRTAPAVAKETRGGHVGEQAVTIAMQQVGEPYRYGGAGPGGFDCSGLVHYSYRHAGKSVPRTTGQLWDTSRTVSRDELQAGDLLFFSIAGKMQHVGLYIGRDRFVHAPSTGKKVQVASLNTGFYENALLRAGRPR